MSGIRHIRKSSTSIHDARIAGLYDLQQTIGRGHFAVVKLANHVFTGEKVAVKVIDKTKLDSKMASHLMQEVRCMKLVQHPNVVRLYEVIDTNTKLFLILELGDYDMYDFIMKNPDKGCAEPEAQRYFSQIIKAIDYCHKLHVVHRDLKPENVVFFEKLGMVKLTDFGFSNKFTPGEQLATACGSLAYSAPEILLGDSYDAPAVDVWSLGVILYMLLCGRLPFYETNDSETLTKILDCKYTLPDTLSDSARHLISRMLIKDVASRATLSELVENAWVAAGELGLDEVLPLVGREILPECAHATIIQQMVAGGVDSEDRILSSLENDDYSYVTATYYLLAERVLAAYREERAKEVLNAERPPFNGNILNANVPTEIASSSYQSSNSIHTRSRSNSWRSNSTVNRRQYSILKEESEEELSSYLRNSSKLSSRYLCSGGVGKEKNWHGIGGGETMVENKTKDIFAHSNRAINFRRNSSPSVSMLTVKGEGERVSPHAIQELLDFSRLNVSGAARRAISPDSRISSRSSSPPNSSGRASPAVGLFRFKSSIPGAGGMRKLSSSPHLLGICEESEEVDSLGSYELRHTPSRRSVSTAVKPNQNEFVEGSKEVKKVDIVVEENDFLAPVTYSKVRMIRPRQAIVSPDMALRYDKVYHLPFRTRRSTSCSSSETSDEDNDRRKNFIVSKCCKQDRNKECDDDDQSKDGESGHSTGMNASKSVDSSSPAEKSDGNDRSKRIADGESSKESRKCESSYGQCFNRTFPVSCREYKHVLNEHMACKSSYEQYPIRSTGCEEKHYLKEEFDIMSCSAADSQYPCDLYMNFADAERNETCFASQRNIPFRLSLTSSSIIL